MEAHPGAVEAHSEAMKLTLEPRWLTLESWRLILDPVKLTLELWGLTLEPCSYTSSP